MCFENLFFFLFHRLAFHSVDGFLFFYLDVSNYLSKFAFVVCIFSFMSKESLPSPMSRSFPSMFSSRSFIVLGIMLKSSINF